MTDDSIVKKVIKGLGEIGEETGKETVKQAGEITESVITGQELFGVKPLSEEELAKKKVEDEIRVQEETKNLLGRNVEQEIKQIGDEKKREEGEKEKQMLEQIRQQREAEEMAGQQVAAPGNPKREAAKTMFAPGKRKKQQPDPTLTSQTSEFTGGKID